MTAGVGEQSNAGRSIAVETQEASQSSFSQLFQVSLPVTRRLITQAQQAIAGIVALPAVRTFQESTPPAALVIIILCGCETSAATAGHEKDRGAILARIGH
jgi:hypothetical protein